VQGPSGAGEAHPLHGEAAQLDLAVGLDLGVVGVAPVGHHAAGEGGAPLHGRGAVAAERPQAGQAQLGGHIGLGLDEVDQALGLQAAHRVAAAGLGQGDDALLQGAADDEAAHWLIVEELVAALQAEGGPHLLGKGGANALNGEAAVDMDGLGEAGGDGVNIEAGGVDHRRPAEGSLFGAQEQLQGGAAGGARVEAAREGERGQRALQPPAETQVDEQAGRAGEAVHQSRGGAQLLDRQREVGRGLHGEDLAREREAGALVEVEAQAVGVQVAGVKDERAGELGAQREGRHQRAAQAKVVDGDAPAAQLATQREGQALHHDGLALGGDIAQIDVFEAGFVETHPGVEALPGAGVGRLRAGRAEEPGEGELPVGAFDERDGGALHREAQPRQAPLVQRAEVVPQAGVLDRQQGGAAGVAQGQLLEGDAVKEIGAQQAQGGAPRGHLGAQQAGDLGAEPVVAALAAQKDEAAHQPQAHQTHPAQEQQGEAAEQAPAHQ